MNPQIPEEVAREIFTLSERFKVQSKQYKERIKGLEEKCDCYIESATNFEMDLFLANNKVKSLEALLNEAKIIIEQAISGKTPCLTCGKVRIPYIPKKPKGIAPQWDNEGHTYRTKSVSSFLKDSFEIFIQKLNSVKGEK